MIMEKIRIIAAISLSIIFVSCGESEINKSTGMDIAGIYIGNITSTASLSESAHAKISISGDNQITFHCYSNSFDSTLVLDIYEHHDLLNVCLTGKDFEKEYGHMMGQNHMMHGHNSSDTNWEHHLSDEHKSDDRHYGYFDKHSQMFYYTFRMSENNKEYDLMFHGLKQ
jgi:hypothetical protein